MNAAQKRQTIERKNALADFNDAKDAGEIGNQTFAAWVPANAPAYMAAKEMYNAAAAANSNAVKVAYGPLAAVWQKDINKISSAMDSLVKMDG